MARLPDERRTPFYENHELLGNPPFIYHTPNPTPEIISPANFDCHWHEGIELLGFVDGSADVTCDAARFAVHAGQIMVINSNQLHTVDSAAGCQYHCLILEHDYCAAHGVDIAGIYFEPVFADGEIMNRLVRLQQESERGGAFAALRTEAQVLMLLAQLCSAHIAVNPAEGRAASRPIELVKKTILFLNEHYRETLSLDEIGSAIGFSKYHLCHTFRAVTGQTVVDMIHARRCRSAQNMLLRGDCTVSECAEACGYNSISYFTRQYRRLIGEPPSETRRRAHG